MFNEFSNNNGHTVSRLSAHIVWVTKYRYAVLEGDIKIRCRTLLIQICEAEDTQILNGVVSKDHVHIHIAIVISGSWFTSKIDERAFFKEGSDGIS